MPTLSSANVSENISLRATYLQVIYSITCKEKLQKWSKQKIQKDTNRWLVSILADKERGTL